MKIEINSRDVARMRPQTKAIPSLICCCFFVCFCGFFFLNGESKSLLNTKEENLTANIASVIIFFLAIALNSLLLRGMLAHIQLEINALINNLSV